MLFRYIRHIGGDTSSSPGATNRFTDAGSISTWASGYMNWAAYQGILGVGTASLDPRGNAQRSHTVATLSRVVNMFSIGAVNLPPLTEIPNAPPQTPTPPTQTPTPPPQTPTPPPQTPTPPPPKPEPLNITDFRSEDIRGYRGVELTGGRLSFNAFMVTHTLRLTIKNNTQTEIIGVDLYAKYTNVFGSPATVSLLFTEQTLAFQGSIRSEHQEDVVWNMSHSSNVYRMDFAIIRYITANGDIVNIPENEQVWFYITRGS
jgi:hypothetical protein